MPIAIRRLVALVLLLVLGCGSAHDGAPIVFASGGATSATGDAGAPAGGVDVDFGIGNGIGLVMGSGGGIVATPISVSITSPTAGATLVAGTPVTITVTVNVAGTVVIKEGSTVLGSATMTGLTGTFSWTPTSADRGAQTINATATATIGGSTANAAGVAVTGTYLGQVATRCYTQNDHTDTRTFMVRSGHWARDSITSLQVVDANWYVNASLVETATGGTQNVHASVEYPAGTFTQILYSGVAAGSVASGGTLVSDVTTVTIPAGAKFWIRRYLQNTVAAPLNFSEAYQFNGAFGDAIEINAGVDRTMSGTVTDGTGMAFSMFPLAIVAQTTVRSVALIGDSRCGAFNDKSNASNGDIGEIARRIGPNFGYINMGRNSDSAVLFLASHAKRLSLLAYCSDTICEYGINDISAGASAATLETRLASIATLLPGKPFTLSTLAPHSSSTDAFATVGNQTTDATNSVRVTHNNWARANTGGFTGTVEVADSVESARDSGLWKAPSYTADGLHETATANAAITFTYP